MTAEVTPELYGIIEEKGIEEVSLKETHGSPKAVFGLWMAANIEFATLTTGALATGWLGLSFSAALTAIVIANVLGGLVLAFFSTFGVTYGLPQRPAGEQREALSHPRPDQRPGRGADLHGWRLLSRPHRQSDLAEFYFGMVPQGWPKSPWSTKAKTRLCPSSPRCPARSAAEQDQYHSHRRRSVRLQRRYQRPQRPQQHGRPHGQHRGDGYAWRYDVIICQEFFCRPTKGADVRGADHGPNGIPEQSPRFPPPGSWA